MIVSESKLVFFEYGLDPVEKDYSKGMFPFQFKDIGSSFNYLGFILKPNN